MQFVRNLRKVLTNSAFPCILGLRLVNEGSQIMSEYLEHKKRVALAIATLIKDSDNPVMVAHDLVNLGKTKNTQGKTRRSIIVRLAPDRVVVTIAATVVNGSGVKAVTVDSDNFKDYHFGSRLPKHVDNTSEFITIS